MIIAAILVVAGTSYLLGYLHGNRNRRRRRRSEYDWPDWQGGA
jgi:hypothetical protein